MDGNTRQNYCELIDLVKQMEWSRAILTPWLVFSDKFNHQFSHAFIIGNMFPESHGFVAMPVTSCIKDTCSNLSYLRRNFLSLWPAQQRNRDSWNMLPNIKTCENGWSNFSENLTVVAQKLLELTQVASPNISIYFNFLWCWGSVVILTFLN